MTKGINFVKYSFAASRTIAPYLEKSPGLIALIPYMLWTITEIVGKRHAHMMLEGRKLSPDASLTSFASREDFDLDFNL